MEILRIAWEVFSTLAGVALGFAAVGVLAVMVVLIIGKVKGW